MDKLPVSVVDHDPFVPGRGRYRVDRSFRQSSLFAGGHGGIPRGYVGAMRLVNSCPRTSTFVNEQISPFLPAKSMKNGSWRSVGQ